jgi:hypothetical protein
VSSAIATLRGLKPGVDAVRAYVFIAIALLCAAGCSKETPAIRVGDREISRPELAGILRPLIGDSLAIEAAVDNIVSRELILQDASTRGIDLGTETTEQLYDRRRERLQNAFLRYKLGLVTVPEDSVQAFYEATGTMVVFTVMNVEDSSLAESLRTAVLSGANMGSLVHGFSTLPPDVENLGRVGPRDLQRISVDDRSLITGLEQGEVSGAAEFRSGWRFIRLDTLYTEDRPPFEEARQQIYDFIWASMSETYKKTLDDSLRTAWSLLVEDGVPQMLASHALNPAGDFSPYSPEQDSMTAYSWRGGRRTVGSLARNIRAIPAFMPRNATDPSWVEGYCSVLGLYDIMAARAVEMGMDTLPDIAAQIRGACDEVILDAWYRAVLEPRLAVSEEDIVTAWEENRSMLVVPERRRVMGVAAVDSLQVARLAALLDAGQDPLDHPSEFTLLASLLEPGESLLTRPLTEADMPGPASERIFALQPGEAASCTLQGGAILFVRLEELIPSREATLEESRAQLESLLRQQQEQTALEGLVDSLRSAYPCDIDLEFLDRFRTVSSGNDGN